MPITSQEWIVELTRCKYLHFYLCVQKKTEDVYQNTIYFC